MQTQATTADKLEVLVDEIGLVVVLDEEEQAVSDGHLISWTWFRPAGQPEDVYA